MSSKLERRVSRLVENRVEIESDAIRRLFQASPEGGNFADCCAKVLNDLNEFNENQFELNLILRKLHDRTLHELESDVKNKDGTDNDKSGEMYNAFRMPNVTVKQDTEEIVERLKRIEAKVNADLATDAADFAVDSADTLLHDLWDKIRGLLPDDFSKRLDDTIKRLDNGTRHLPQGYRGIAPVMPYMASIAISEAAWQDEMEQCCAQLQTAVSQLSTAIPAAINDMLSEAVQRTHDHIDDQVAAVRQDIDDVVNHLVNSAEDPTMTDQISGIREQLTLCCSSMAAATGTINSKLDAMAPKVQQIKDIVQGLDPQSQDNDMLEILRRTRQNGAKIDAVRRFLQ